MAAEIQRSGFGFEKFFRRRNLSAERTKEPEKHIKSKDNVAEITETKETEVSPAKLSKNVEKSTTEQKTPESPDDSKTIAISKDIDEDTSQKTDSTKNSSKKKKQNLPDSSIAKADDIRKDSEACKEYVIQDDVGQAKLREIINNSIKEAVLNIVKESVCPLTDALDPRGKEPVKKVQEILDLETQNKDNKSTKPKNIPSLQSGANKTFDSHVIPKQNGRSRASQIPCKLIEQERITVNRLNRELCSSVRKDRKEKGVQSKNKKFRDLSPRVRQAKGTSHFRTDNRRMTGNVNIYICSEANENAKDKKTEKEKIETVDDSESATESNTSPSTLSISTSKLVAALRKKQRKNLEDESLSCLCAKPESFTKQDRSVGQVEDDADDIVCLCDETEVNDQFLETPLSSTEDTCLYEDTKYSDLDFRPAPDLNANMDLRRFNRVCNPESCPSDTESLQYSNYDQHECWPCPSEDFLDFNENSCRTACPSISESNDIAGKSFDDRCSCCNSKRCQQDRSRYAPCSQDWKRQSQQSFHRNNRYNKSNKYSGVTYREFRDHQFNKCTCIIEEEDENCCTDGKDWEEKLTFCGKLSIDDKQDSQNQTDMTNKENSVKSSSSILKHTKLQTTSSKSEVKIVSSLDVISKSSKNKIGKQDEPIVEEDNEKKSSKPQSPKLNLLPNIKKTTKKPKPIDQGENPDVEKNRENSEAFKNDTENVSAATDDKRKNSLFYRSIKRAMDFVIVRKDDKVVNSEAKKKIKGCSPECETKSKTEEDITDGKDKESCGPLCSGIDQEKFIPISVNNTSPKKRSRSRIGTALTNRRSSATTSNNISNLSLSLIETEAAINPENLPTIEETLEIPDSKRVEEINNEKLFESTERCCKDTETLKNEYCKCTMNPEQSTKITCCSTCINPIDRCTSDKEPVKVVNIKCKCCPTCKKPIDECTCNCTKQNSTNDDCCKCCRRAKWFCCCDSKGNSKNNRTPSPNCRQPVNLQESLRQCRYCCRAKTECCCNRGMCLDCNDWKPNSMICVYCDKSLENCVCKSPRRKCSQCEFSLDVCNCIVPSDCDCNGRKIESPESNGDQTICVTAWKTRRDVRRYFARNNNEEDDIFEENCSCYDKSKPYGSDGLPYQKRSVFSDVMTELQQKISDSMYCTVCKDVPCCCCTQIGMEFEDKTQRKFRSCLSPITERKRSPRERTRSKSPANNSCKCAPSPRRKVERRFTALKICDICRRSPCRCHPIVDSSRQKKPQAKCYYCKGSPCICTPITESINARQFRNNDSSRRRKKDCGVIDEKAIAEMNDENREYQGFKHNREILLPCQGSRQTRKYCYRGNPAAYPFHPEECVR